MAGLPDSWQFGPINPGGGQTATIVVPAGGSGVSRVLTHIDYGLYTAVALALLFTVQILDGATVIGSLVMAINNVAGAVADNRASWDGVLPGTPGNSLTVQFTTNNVNVGELLAIQGYDL
jgi:hypothetical protein